MRQLTSSSDSGFGGHRIPHSVYTELQRGETLVEKQVKEARTKCRSIASLLTDAPNPNSKGVLMFKKRRQRAKKYTLTCFGKAEGDRGGETGGETEEEGGSSIPSGSEVDEPGYFSSFDSTWDTGYLDVLDNKSSACPSSAPTTPKRHHSPELDISVPHPAEAEAPTNQSPGLERSANQDPRLDSSITRHPISVTPKSVNMSPPALALTNGGSVAVSRASVFLSVPTQTPLSEQNGHHANPNTNPNVDSDHNLQNSNPGNVLNRTARPFTQGTGPSRASVTSVMFHPPQPKSAIPTVAKPMAADASVTISPTHHLMGPDAKRAVSSTSLYIPPRNSNNSSVITTPSTLSPPTPLSSTPLYKPQTSPQTSLHASPFSPSSTLFSPSTPQDSPACPSSAQLFSSSAPQTQTPLSFRGSNYPPPTGISTPNMPQTVSKVSIPAQPTYIPLTPQHLSPPVHPCINTASGVTSESDAIMATAASSHASATDSMATREQRISVPAARTGILHDARRRSSKKPMFSSVQNRDVSPNPHLLNMVQNMDDRFARGPNASGLEESGAGPSAEPGHEYGPDEDWLRLGAEACNFMQAQRGSRPPPTAPKPQASQVPQLAGKGGQLFARRQNRMDRYIVERSPSVAAAPYTPGQTREPSPTPSLPATWKYSPNIRAPPPISYNPLLSPSCPLKAQKKAEVIVSKPGGSKAGRPKAGVKPVDISGHQPYQLNSSLFTYGGGAPQYTSPNQQMTGASQMPMKTPRVHEVKRFSTPPPTATGPALKVIVPRSATTLGEPLWRSNISSPPPRAAFIPYQHYQPEPQMAHCPPQPQWGASPLSPPPPPAPNAPLPQLPTFSASAPNPNQSCSFSHLQTPNAAQADRQFKSAPDLSPFNPTGASRPASISIHPARVPRPRFSTSNLGLQPCVWRPGASMH